MADNDGYTIDDHSGMMLPFGIKSATASFRLRCDPTESPVPCVILELGEDHQPDTQAVLVLSPGEAAWLAETMPILIAELQDTASKTEAEVSAFREELDGQ